MIRLLFSLLNLMFYSMLKCVSVVLIHGEPIESGEKQDDQQ